MDYQNYLKSEYCSKVNTGDEFNIIVKVLRCCGCKSMLNPLFDQKIFDHKFLHVFRLKKNGKLKKDNCMLTYNIYLHNMCEYIKAFKLHRRYGIKSYDIQSFQARLKMLRSKFRKGRNLDRVIKRKIEQDWIEKYLTPENVTRFCRSEYHSMAANV